MESIVHCLIIFGVLVVTTGIGFTITTIILSVLFSSMMDRDYILLTATGAYIAVVFISTGVVLLLLICLKHNYKRKIVCCSFVALLVALPLSIFDTLIALLSAIGVGDSVALGRYTKSQESTLFANFIMGIIGSIISLIGLCMTSGIMCYRLSNLSRNDPGNEMNVPVEELTRTGLEQNSNNVPEEHKQEHRHKVPEERTHNIPEERRYNVPEEHRCNVHAKRRHIVPAERTQNELEELHNIPEERRNNVPEERWHNASKKNRCNGPEEHIYNSPEECRHIVLDEHRHVPEESKHNVPGERRCNVPDENRRGYNASEKRRYQGPTIYI